MVPADLTRRRLLQSGAAAAAALVTTQVGIPGAAALPKARRRADFNQGVFANEARLFAADYTPIGWKPTGLTGRALMGSGQVPGGPLRRLGDRGDGAALATTGVDGEWASLPLTYITPESIPDAYGVLTGEIRPFAFSSPPAGWLPCDAGGAVQIAGHSELFSILGTTFGGDGRATFGLPTLYGMSPLEAGDAGRLPDATFGQRRRNLKPWTSGPKARLHFQYCVCSSGHYPVPPRSEMSPNPLGAVVEGQFIGEIRAFVGPLPDADWLPCDGRLLPFRGHEELYDLIRDRFGGNRTYFQLPDLRGRVTADVFRQRELRVGSTSGATGATDTAIPYEVVNWAIATSGQNPFPA
jgi:microcystin-dependent protein